MRSPRPDLAVEQVVAALVEEMERQDLWLVADGWQCAAAVVLAPPPA